MYLIQCLRDYLISIFEYKVLISPGFTFLHTHSKQTSHPPNSISDEKNETSLALKPNEIKQNNKCNHGLKLMTGKTGQQQFWLIPSNASKCVLASCQSK